jgi:hypothetical protein
MTRIFKTLVMTLAAGGTLLSGAVALACPFCDAPAQTLSEETASADAVVLAKLIKEAPPVTDPSDPNSGNATFQVIDVLRGKERLGEAKEVQAIYFGEANKEQVFLISGLGADKLDWTTPLPLSDAAVDYVRKLPAVPASGVERLVFFQDYLENDDPLLAQDAYDEFARAPYEDVLALGPKMQHDRLVEWISDLEINPSRRRLYLTMLGACGGKDDLPLLESMIVSDFSKLEPSIQEITSTGLAMRGPLGLASWAEIVQHRERQKKLGLDALVACYLTLRGADGLDLVDDRFLKDPKVDYTYVYSTIMALRFHGDQETGAVPKDRLLKSIRLLLDNPDFADQVILDLSRWEDWSVLDRLVQMFKTADEKSYVRQPVVTYLTVASEQPGDVGRRAATALKELEDFDPDTVKQARSLMAFGALARAKPGGDASGANAGAQKDTSETPDDTQAFAATAADNETDAAEIPDPADYENSSTTGGVAKPDDAAAKQAKTAPAATTSTAAPAVDGTAAAANPLLIVGVPLLAAGALMAVYWAILRIGAV